MKFLRNLPQAARTALAAFSCLCLAACSAAQEAAFLSNAPAVISGALATGQELAAAYSAAQQSVGSNGGKLNATTGLAAAQAAFGSAASANLGTTVKNVFAAANQLGADIKAANPSATTAQIAAAQSSAITSAQIAIQAAAPAGSPAATTAVFQVHCDHGKLYVTNERPLSSSKQLTYVSPLMRLHADLRAPYGCVRPESAYDLHVASN
jgi:hypothetical protein